MAWFQSVEVSLYIHLGLISHILGFTILWLNVIISNHRQISKKHQIRLDTPWLDPTKTLVEQEVTENDELILMYRFYYHMQLQR